MLTVKRTDLATALVKVGKVIDKPAEDTVYQCVHCVPAQDALYLHATNGTIWCSVFMEAQGTAPPFLVHWDTLRRFAVANRVETLTLEVKAKGVLLKGEGCRAVLAMPDVRNFPEWPEMPPQAWASLEGEVFAGMVGRVLGHNTKKVVSSAMVGFHLEIGEGTIGLTATDGKHLAHAETNAGRTNEVASVVVPEPTLEILGKCKGTLMLAVNQFQLAASWDRTTLLSRLVDGEFPNWRGIAAIPLPREVVIERAGLTAAMRQLVDIGEHCGVRIEPGSPSSPGSAFLWGIGKMGQASIRLECRTEVAETLFLVPAQVFSFLQKMDGDEVILRWGQPRGPIRLVDPAREGDINISMGCLPIASPTEGIADA